MLVEAPPRKIRDGVAKVTLLFARVLRNCMLKSGTCDSSASCLLGLSSSAEEKVGFALIRLVRLQCETLLGWLVLHVCVCVCGCQSVALRSEMCFFSRKIRESASSDCKGSERRASQCTSLVLQSCDFQLGLRKCISCTGLALNSCGLPDGAAEVHFGRWC